MNKDDVNINLYKGLEPPIPFEESWDLSKISNGEQFRIMISEFMYSQLLESILENDINNNVIIDTDRKNGIVYINHIDKYIPMKIEDIVEKSMEKLNEHLNIINRNNEVDILKYIIKISKKILNKKYIDFHKDIHIKNGVSNLFCNIYEANKDKAQKNKDNVMKIKKNIQFEDNENILNNINKGY